MTESSRIPPTADFKRQDDEFENLLDQYERAVSEDWVADALRYKGGLRRLFAELRAELASLRDSQK